MSAFSQSEDVGLMAKGEQDVPVVVKETDNQEETEEETKEVEEEKTEEKALDYADWSGVDVIEGSLCVECGGTGKTMLMLHKIPFFREIIIGSFKCNDCHARNNEVTFGGEIQSKGSRVELKITHANDLNRQVIKSDSASISIPELEFEIPPGTQKGEITTLEGILKQAATNLSLYQRERMQQQPDVGAKVALIIMHLHRYAAGEIIPFTIVLDDCSGNSFIENLRAPSIDPNMKIIKYVRTSDQDVSLGLNPQQEGTYDKDNVGGGFDDMFKRPFGGSVGQVASAASAHEQEQILGTTTLEQAKVTAPYPLTETEDGVRLGRDEIMTFQEPCPNCSKIGECRNAMTNIPHFKEVLIMAFNCQFCGYRTNEVKGGGAIPAMGMQITLTINSEEDMKRDVLKGHSAMLIIPQMDLELSHGSLGGVYTTIEGLMNKIYTNLRDNNPFAIGDSVMKHHSEEESTNKREFVHYLKDLKDLCDGKVFPFSIILRDPLANSFVSAPIGSFLPPESDKPLDIIEYIRTYEEEDEFGIVDMNTKDFETLGNMTEAEKETYYLPESILADRITHVTTKGPDHPRAFAQGVQDKTEGGVVFNHNKTIQTAYLESQLQKQQHGQAGVEEEEEGEYLQAPAGYSASKVAKGGIEDYPASLRIRDSATESPSSFTATIAAAAAAREEELANPPKRNLGDDSALISQFDAREEFAGGRKGFVFRLGSLGLGYYPDVRNERTV